MSANETRRGNGGLGNSAGGRVRFHSTEPADLTPEELAWSRGFHTAWDFLAPVLARAEADRDRYYYLAFNSDEARARHREMLKAFDVANNRTITAEKWAELDRIAAERSEAIHV